MKPRLLWMPLFRWSESATDSAWRLLAAERFRLAHVDRAHVVYDCEDSPPSSVIQALPSLSSTHPTEGVRGWAKEESVTDFHHGFDLELVLPDGDGPWGPIAALADHSGLARLMLRRAPEQTLSDLGPAAARVPHLAREHAIWIDGRSWGWEAAYWALSLYPEWHVYGGFDLAFASSLAQSTGRLLSVVDLSGAPAKSILADAQFGRTAPDRATFRNDPAPTIWL